MDALENLANGATLLQASVWLIGAAVAGGGIVLGGQAAFTRKRGRRSDRIPADGP
jgi:hypothetical protein